MQFLKTTIMALAIIPIAIVCAHAGTPNLQSASSFAVLGGTTVTSTGTTVITGNVGVSPGTAVTGFLPGIVDAPYTIHAGDAVAAQAEADTFTLYNTLAGTAYTADLTGQDLGGQTLLPGVYHFDTSAPLDGTLTLNGNGDPNSVFIIQTGTTLISGTSSAVDLINGANAADVFFQVGSSATLGTDTAFEGNILAYTSITLVTGSTILDGRALAINGATTMDDNTIDIPTGLGETAVPEPSETVVMGFGILALVGLLLHARKRRVLST
jgi:hypothetical protein